MANNQPSPAEELRIRFTRLADKWKRDTMYISSATVMAEHPAYREIVRIGWAMVPLMIGRLRHEPDHWFQALREITGENPVPEEDRGKVAKMAEAWVRWFDAWCINGPAKE